MQPIHWVWELMEKIMAEVQQELYTSKCDRLVMVPAHLAH